jgi:hypothetical protein
MTIRKTSSSVKPTTHKDMNFKVTIGIWNAKDKTEAEKRINDMLDAYDLHNFSDVEINWLDTDEGEVKPM